MPEPITSLGPPGQGGEGPLGEAARRFEEALNGLEAHLQDRLSGDAADRDMTDDTLGQLSSELSQARRRERALREAAVEASAALGRAAAEVRAALAASDEPDAESLEQEAEVSDKAE